MLYVVATPIGNMGDLSHRAIEVLGEVDYLLCEDTRHTVGLLKRYGVEKRLVSYHQHNEAQRCDEVIGDLKEGMRVALVSDAGTPGISDPGQRLVERCRAEGVKVTALPGACAAINALVLSGFATERFQFVGFLPKKEGELRNLFADLTRYAGVSICYESPHRLRATLKLLDEVASDIRVAVAREMTKKFEEVIVGKPAEIGEVRGEVVLLIEGLQDIDNEWLALSPEEHVTLLVEQYGLSKMDAVKATAKMRGVPKREIYGL